MYTHLSHIARLRGCDKGGVRRYERGNKYYRERDEDRERNQFIILRQAPDTYNKADRYNKIVIQHTIFLKIQLIFKVIKRK